MRAKDCLLYSGRRVKNTADAWSYIINSLSYPVYYPKGYKPISLNVAQNWRLEIEELFEEFKKYGWVYLNEKGNWEFKKLNIKDIISEMV